MVVWYLFLGADRVWYHDGDHKIFFDRNTLDQTLAKALLADVSARSVAEIIVITGPGGFTNLRVGSLVCNLLAHYHPSVSFRVVSKLDCYKRCVNNKILPPQWLLYIGQQKSVWDYDFDTDIYTVVAKDISVDEDCFVEYIDGYHDVVDEKKKVRFDIDAHWLYLYYQWIHYLSPLLAIIELSDTVQPSYYVQPIIGTPAQN